MSGTRYSEYLPSSKARFLSDLYAMFFSLWRSRLVALNLLHNQLTVRYQGSSLGVLWAVLSPLLMMIAIAIIFPFLMRVKMENYVVYLFAGLMFWRVVGNVIVSGGMSLLSQQAMIQKTSLPSLLFPIVVVVAEFINFFFVLVGLYFVGLLFGFEMHIKYLYLLASVVISFLFCVGLTSVVSMMIVYFRDIKHVLDVLMQAFFYLTPIIYPITFLPEYIRDYMLLNPFYHFVRLFQEAIYEPGQPDWGAFFWPMIMTGVLLLLGSYIHSRYGRFVIFRL